MICSKGEYIQQGLIVDIKCTVDNQSCPNKYWCSSDKCLKMNIISEECPNFIKSENLV